MAARFCKLEQYCPTADLFSLYHTRETAFLDSSLTSKYGNFSIIGLYSYLKAEETDGILKVNGTVQKESLLDFLNQYLKEHKEENPTNLPAELLAISLMITAGVLNRFQAGIKKRFQCRMPCLSFLIYISSKI